MTATAPRTRLDPLRRAAPAALLALAFAAGCSQTPPPAAPTQAAPPPAATAGGPAAAPADPDAVDADLPPLLRGIDLTAAQVVEVWRINADLERDLATFVSAANDLAGSVAGAARQCKGDTPFIEQDGLRLVREGEAIRGPVLDAVQRFYQLLTPAQRKKISDRLVEGDDWAKRERNNSKRTRDLGPVLELGTVQMMQMLVKAAVLWSHFADKAEPFRAQYHDAITHFGRDDFDAHHEPIGAAPAVAIGVDFVRTGLRLLIPLLEPKQCEALAGLIDQKLEENAKRAAERSAKGEKALAKATARAHVEPK